MAGEHFSSSRLVGDIKFLLFPPPSLSLLPSPQRRLLRGVRFKAKSFAERRIKIWGRRKKKEKKSVLVCTLRLLLPPLAG